MPLKSALETIQSDGFSFSSNSEKRRIRMQLVERQKVCPVVVFDTGEVVPLRLVEELEASGSQQITASEIGRHLVDGLTFEKLVGSEPAVPGDLATPEQLAKLS